MASRTRIANEAWEALFRAQATVARELAAADVWGEVSPREYGVLYALSTAPPAGLRMSELLDDVLVTQGGMSRLVARMEAAGLIERAGDPDDGRASRIRLTEAGASVQRTVGLRHGHHVAQAMTRALDAGRLRQLRDLCALLTAATRGSEARVDRLALQRQDAEHALVDAVQRLPADEPLERLDPEGELADRE